LTEAGHEEELHAASTDLNRQRTGNRSSVNRANHYGKEDRGRVPARPKFELTQDARIMKLFNLAKQRNFAELQAAHQRLLNEGADALERPLDVYLYSRLMTQCVRHVGNETALPVFELMLQAGVTPNVVPYTIVIRALLELAVSVWALCILELDVHRN